MANSFYYNFSSYYRGFNYFFYNRKLKRIVLFTCRALSPFSQSYYDSGGVGPDYDEDDDMD